MVDAPDLPVRLVPLQSEHWPQVKAIYAAGIATGHATFETEPPTWSRFHASKLPGQRIVAVDRKDAVVGWIAAAAVSDRAVYAGVVEHSVYVDRTRRRCRIGRALLDGLIASTEAAGIWTIQSGVFPENVASIRLHQAAGFRLVGTRQRLGRMAGGPLAGQWRDVVMIERRSRHAGLD